MEDVSEGAGWRRGGAVNWLDAAIIALVIWFTIAAFTAGFIRETVTVLSAVLGVLLAGVFYRDLAQDVSLAMDSENLSNVIAFGAIFGATVLAGQIAASLLKPAVHTLQLGMFDQLAGAAFGMLKGLIFVEVFLIVFVRYDSLGLKDVIHGSFLGTLILEHAPVLTRILPHTFQDYVNRF